MAQGCHARIIEPYGGPTIPVNELIDGVTITRFASTKLRLFNTAAFACLRSGKRRLDLLLLGLLLELGFCFMTVASVPPINDQRNSSMRIGPRQDMVKQRYMDW
jgi:hypothetical protein